MTDVQVSNARRIGFTALALVAFWLLAYRAYWIGGGEAYEFPVFDRLSGAPDDDYWTFRWLIVSSSFTVFPTILLSLSTRNSLRPRDWNLLSTVLLTITLWISYSHGESCAFARLHEIKNQIREANARLYSRWNGLDVLREARQTLESDWQGDLSASNWLLLPIMLTTAFVIFGAWRSAVRARDAGAAPADEEERLTDSGQERRFLKRLMFVTIGGLVVLPLGFCVLHCSTCGATRKELALKGDAYCMRIWARAQAYQAKNGSLPELITVSKLMRKPDFISRVQGGHSDGVFFLHYSFPDPCRYWLMVVRDWQSNEQSWRQEIED